MVFLDGVGIGKRDYQFNPFFKYGFNTFEQIFGEIPSLENTRLVNEQKFLFPTDANLGVEGLPQSGTGQASIFCGFNAPKFAGKHYGPYPFTTTIPKLQKDSLLVYYKEKFNSSYFANAYPKVFFDYVNSGRSRLSVTTLTCRLSGIRLNTVTDVRKGNALTAEITNERWNQRLGYKLNVIKPKSAARRLLRISHKYKFTLYEYFLTDKTGHSQQMNLASSEIFKIDLFLETLLSLIDLDKHTVILTSDHGNIEDISVKTHTRNQVMTIIWGRGRNELKDRIHTLTDVTPAVLWALETFHSN